LKKKLAFALATLLAVGVVATTASATGPVAELDGFACGILDADGNIVASAVALRGAAGTTGRG
jgi:molybdopterin biosynthesis enzyme